MKKEKLIKKEIIFEKEEIFEDDFDLSEEEEEQFENLVPFYEICHVCNNMHDYCDCVEEDEEL